MRHVRSILYALVLSLAVWILCGVGFTQDLTGRARDAGSVETASAILLLVLAGAAYAILVFSPISPLGPAVFGLLFLAISLWAVIAPDSYAGVWPAGVTKEGFDLSRPGYALAILLAVPMLCTALSVRRWRGYEPPQLPLIGTLGRARGAAVAPGVPVAAERTAVITTADPTEVITLPAPSGPDEPATEAVPTQAVLLSDGDEPTALIPASPAPSDEPTIPVAPATSAGDEPTVVPVAEPADSEPVDSDEQTEAAVAEEPAGADPDETAASDTVEMAEPLSEDTVAMVADAEPVEADDEPVATDEAGPPATPYDSEPTADEDEDTDPVGARAEPAAAPADEPTEVPAAVEDEPTETITADTDDGDEHTQVLRLPVARTDPDPDETTRPLERGDRTLTAGPGESTQVIFWREPVDQPTPEEAARAQPAADQTVQDRAAQDRARQAFRDRAAQERAKEAFAERAAQDAREHGEQTQVINLAALRDQPIPGDQTQVLPGASRTKSNGDRTQKLPDARTVELAGDQTQVLPDGGDHTLLLPRGGTVEPPGDRTQVLSFPTTRPAAPRPSPGEHTTDKHEPATRASSIVGAEQPDPGADPTTRLNMPRPAGQGTGEATTADVGDNRRTKGVLDLERPADETADDTRRLVVPPQRRPSDDEPTTRL